MRCGQGRVESLLHLRPEQVHRLQPLRARLRRNAGHLRADDLRAAASKSRVSPGRTSPSWSASASAAAPASRPARPPRCRKRRVIELGQPEHSVITTCAYCGVGCGFKAEMKGNEVVRMVPWKDGKANEGHSCVKGRFAWGYATHKDRITKPMIRKKHHRPVARGQLGRGDRLRRQRVQAHPGQVRPGFDRRHHLLALHQRRDLPGAEAGARRLRQQQRRHLRPRLPFAHRLRPEADAGRHRPARRPSSRSRRPT